MGLKSTISKFECYIFKIKVTHIRDLLRCEQDIDQNDDKRSVTKYSNDDDELFHSKFVNDNRKKTALVLPEQNDDNLIHCIT